MFGDTPSGTDRPLAFHPVSCPSCRGTARLREQDLLRLPSTIVFQCPFCRVVAVVDAAGRPSAARPRGSGDGRAA